MLDKISLIGRSIAYAGRKVGVATYAAGSAIGNTPVAKAAVTAGYYASLPVVAPLKYAAKSTPGRVTRNAFANLASEMSPNILGSVVSIPGFRHDDDAYLVAHSPAAEARKLKQYSQSYDLKNYSKHMQEASDLVKKSQSSLLSQSNDSTVDVLTFGEFGKLIEKKSEHTVRRDVNIGYLNTKISGCILKETLGEVQNKFIYLKQEIDSESEDYSEPAQIIKAYKEIHDKAFAKLEEDKKASIENIKVLFADRTPTEDISDFKKSLASLLGIEHNAFMSAEQKDNLDKQLNKHMKSVIDHVEESYAKTKSSLEEAFKDKPAKKENDKEIPGVAGLNKKVEHLEKERCEAKLLKKIYRLEDLEKRGYKLPGQQLNVQVGNNTQAVDPSVRKKCLKKKSEKDLESVDLDNAWLYGKNKSDPHHTTISGTKLEYGKDNNGEVNSVSIEIPGSWFTYHNTGDHRMLADYEDMVKEIKSMQNDKDVQTIHFKHDTSIDELRNQMIIDSFRAARKNGILTKDIRMTCTGGDKEHTFIEKPITEIMQALGLSCPEIEADAKQAQEEREKQNSKDLASVKSRYDDLKAVPDPAPAADAGEHNRIRP